MPLAYRVDAENRLIVAAGYGTVTDDEVFDYQRRIAARTETAGYDELLDVSQVDRIVLTSTDRVNELASEAAGMDAMRGSSKLAIVAPSDLAYGLGRMFQARREMDRRTKRIVGVFRTMAEALSFLELDSAPSLPPPE